MPPKAKFDKETIVSGALELVRSAGMQALTARALGAKLHSSARPIFTVFDSMEEVQQEVLSRVRKLYASYIHAGLADPQPFKAVGTQYIRFAIEQPRFFRLLFMTERPQIPGISDVLPQIDESYDAILQAIQTEYGLPPVKAQLLYKHLWIYTHGIASLCATDVCRFTPKEIGDMMTDVFRGVLEQIQRKEDISCCKQKT